MVKRTDFLTEDAKAIREEVFMAEQGFQTEFDDVDARAVHLVFYEAGEPAATCRYYAGEEKGLFWLGRVAVRRPFRGTHIGAQLVRNAEKEIQKDGGSIVQLSAQVRVRAFYEKSGYQAVGDVYLDEGCPHVCMRKELIHKEKRKGMKIERIDRDFSICKIQSAADVDFQDAYCFVGKTDAEISLVCSSGSVPEHVLARDDGWKALRIQGELDFSLVGILSEISSLLAENGIGIFAVSTYNTDYIFTKTEKYEKALAVLEQAGYPNCDRTYG